MDAQERADLDRYLAAVASGGAKVLSNASLARKVLAAADTTDQPTVPSGALFPTAAREDTTHG